MHPGVWLLTAALGASAGLDSAGQTRLHPSPDWEIWMGLSADLRPQRAAAGGLGVLGVNRKLGRIWRPELGLGLGAVSGPGAVVTSMRLGTRIEYPRVGWVPYLWLGFAHQHESGFELVVANPLAELLGLSEHGVVHRSGGEAGLGVSYDFRPVGRNRANGRVGLRLAWAHLWGGGPADSLHGSLTIGVGF